MADGSDLLRSAIGLLASRIGRLHAATGSVYPGGGFAERRCRTEWHDIGENRGLYRRRAGHIITIDVLPETRRSGIGSSLLQAAEDRLRQAGAIVVELETAVDNAAAIQFYKRKEYFVEKTVRGYYSNQLDALVMRKDLVAVPVKHS